MKNKLTPWQTILSAAVSAQLKTMPHLTPSATFAEQNPRNAGSKSCGDNPILAALAIAESLDNVKKYRLAELANSSEIDKKAKDSQPYLVVAGSGFVMRQAKTPRGAAIIAGRMGGAYHAQDAASYYAFRRESAVKRLKEIEIIIATYEEAGEALQAATKMQRHDESYSAPWKHKTTNAAPIISSGLTEAFASRLRRWAKRADLSQNVFSTNGAKYIMSDSLIPAYIGRAFDRWTFAPNLWSDAANVRLGDLRLLSGESLRQFVETHTK